MKIYPTIVSLITISYQVQHGLNLTTVTPGVALPEKNVRDNLTLDITSWRVARRLRYDILVL